MSGRKRPAGMARQSDMSRWIGIVLLTLATPIAAAEQTWPPNIVLIVIDTLRYGATGSNNMPFLSSLASRGVSFMNAYSTHDFTPTSHFSIFTGFQDGLGTDDDRAENGIPYQLRQ